MPRSKADDVGVDEKPASTSTVPVVGIGASAGGLTALESFLPAIKRGAGLAFVIVQHLDPDHESLLAELLERLSPIPVSTITHETPVDADHIYVIPPNAALTIVNAASSSRWPTRAASERRASSCRAPAATARSACAPSRMRAASRSPRRVPSMTS